MRLLLSDSKSILTNAKTKYDAAAMEIDRLNGRLVSFKKGIDQILDENSAEHKAWTKQVRAGVYGTAGALTTGMIFADIFGCLGFCSAVVTSSTWIASVSAVEVEIARVTAKIEEVEETVINALEDIDEIGTLTQDLQKFIQQEIIIIIIWDSAVDHMNTNIENVEEESFYRLPLKKRIFTNAVKGLRTAAQDLWDQPDGIFGESPLNRELGNDAEYQKNYQAELNVRENIRKYNIKYSNK